MKNLTTALALAAALCTGSAFAASHKEAPDMKAASGAAGTTQPMMAASGAAPTKQQGKMATCNHDAEGKKGDERKAFMKECLSAQKETQQNKMKTCNADAKGKKGDERKAFMKECLSASKA